MELDAKSWKILQIVQRDGRISLTDLAPRVALSLPATSERLKRLEESGVIEAYCATISAEKAGYGVMALIGMTTPQPNKARLISQLQQMPEVLECLHVTGQDSFILGDSRPPPPGALRRQHQPLWRDTHVPRHVRAYSPPGAGTAT